MSQAIGIYFGPEHITVSKAGDGDSFDHIDCHSASPAYQEFFQLVLQKRVQGDLNSRPREEVPDTYHVPPPSQSGDVENLLREELEAVIERIPDAAKIVPTITIPYHWNFTVQRATFKAAEGAKIPLAGIHMLLRMPRAVERAYELDSRIVLDDYFFIVVDYNTEYMHLLICETAKGGGYGIVEGQVQLAHLGENPGSKEGYREAVIEAINKFISLTTVDGESWIDVKPPYHLIKAVLLSGNASSRGMEQIREVLQQVFEPSLIHDSYPPLYAGAIGAAGAAKGQIENPKSTDDFICAPIDIPDEPKPVWMAER